MTARSAITAAGLLLASCSGGRHVVTATPLDIGVVSPRLCIAIDPSRPDGVWWWEPGAVGCSTRSTGPDVFHADEARVERTSDVIDVRFRLQLIVADPHTQQSFTGVSITIDRHTFRSSATGAEVATIRRARLDMAEQVGRSS